ncbi:MAG: NAD(P)/FAD-dependent oxidoreductase [Candidatus Thermoplasmatota archaeon]|nr:NAD(P)/FAD-dependent oxidoreductase [Candidatus Thermoplasmatota archaeon]
MSAFEASRAGARVVLLDSRKEVGLPVQCGEAISENTLNLTGLKDDGEWIAHTVEGFRVRSPSGFDLYTRLRGFSIRRDLLEKELASRAASNGAVILSSATVESAELKDGRWLLSTRKGTITAGFVIIACGANQYLPVFFGFEGHQNSFRGIGIKLKRKDFGNDLIFLVKGDLKGGYGWYFPRGDGVNAGVCALTDLTAQLDWLKRTLSIRDDEIISYHGGAIPVDGLRAGLIGSSCLLVGDAGGFSNPITKGGIIGAVLSGREAGKAVASFLAGDGTALTDWEGRMRSHTAFSPLNLKRAEFLASLEDGLLNEITGLVSGREINTIPTSELMRLVLSRPDLLKRMKKGVHLVRGGREWMKWSF